MWRLTLLGCLACGCNLVLPLGGAGDLSVADTSGGAEAGNDFAPDLERPDAVVDAAVLPSFGNIQPVAELNTATNEDDPTLPADMLEIYFEHGQDIWRATRGSTGDSWGAPAAVAELNTSLEDGTPGISADGLTIYLLSARDDPNQIPSIYMATRKDRGAPWSTPVPVPELSSGSNDSCPFPASDVLIVLDSDRSGGQGGRDLFRASRATGTDPWGSPVVVAELNTGGEDSCAFLSSDGRLILFGSDRDNGVMNIFVATRTDAAAPFDPPTKLPQVNSASEDADPWLSPDMKTLYFSSSRNGTQDIFVARAN